jgi:hypothetical protein
MCYHAFLAFNNNINGLIINHKKLEHWLMLNVNSYVVKYFQKPNDKRTL